MLVHCQSNPDLSIGKEFRSFDKDVLSEDFKLSKTRLFGSQTLSYSAAMQSGLYHFANNEGFLAYQKLLGHTFVMGDPLIAQDKMKDIVLSFLREHKNVTFCQVSEGVADLLNDQNYWVNELGIDTRLDLDSYDFNGKEKERFRYATNWLQKRGFEVVESVLDTATTGEVELLCEKWRQSRILKNETAFLNRPIVLVNEPDVRRFLLRDKNKKLMAFVFFDPIYRSGKVVGYVTTFKRRHPDAPSMAEVGICKFAIEKFKNEGLQIVRLGMSPFANISDNRLHYNRVLKWVFKYYFGAWWVNRFMFNLKGHADFKRRFRGIEEKTYFASPSWFNDVRLFALMRLCKII